MSAATTVVRSAVQEALAPNGCYIHRECRSEVIGVYSRERFQPATLDADKPYRHPHTRCIRLRFASRNPEYVIIAFAADAQRAPAERATS